MHFDIEQNHHHVQDALEIGLGTQALVRKVLVLPRRRLVRPAANDDFAICRNAPCGQVLVLPRRRLVRPAANDNFAICKLFSMIIYVIKHGSASIVWFPLEKIIQQKL